MVAMMKSEKRIPTLPIPNVSVCNHTRTRTGNAPTGYGLRLEERLSPCKYQTSLARNSTFTQIDRITLCSNASNDVKSRWIEL
ncbi:hypothetical protein M427DRAFT_65058 [Gonapodya prolifera JEL478]|uniref:Uncharacterized protein n=1 Tax=Gonapodya prolifera (strain JEL478) TaxID=1344416 RepID=A0A138ZX89_GONPJ|nr:hypothetical protein M427DRAFT_65058 [Gonapodya prolifera JEL478]|eukprot:KXS08895.1 hypothetical protein M427DRAFT_65058 [Gonapodya prolifera JEL478]